MKHPQLLNVTDNVYFVSFSPLRVRLGEVTTKETLSADQLKKVEEKVGSYLNTNKREDPRRKFIKENNEKVLNKLKNNTYTDGRH